MNKIMLLPIFLIIIGGIAGNALRFTEQPPEQTADFSEIPLTLDNRYIGNEYAIDLATAEVLKATVSTNRVYNRPDGFVFQLFMAYFDSQKYGSQIHSPKHCLPGGGWQIDSIEPYNLTLPDGSVKTVNYCIIRDLSKHILMLYWYETRSGAIRSEYGLKFDLVKNSLMFRPTDAAIIRVTIDARGRSLDELQKAGLEFIDSFYPYMKKSLPF